ncbi:MAG: AgmX/PglI C-terminal domain-containing protein [Deltaproteobacteria bacterium]|nr:AgmX/PglI C-terminal domain-containing protein [Deltaproteobacteria bacterium]
MKHRWEDLESCFEEKLRSNPQLSGEQNASFSIDGFGVANRIEVQSNLAHSSHLSRCISAYLQYVSFPKNIIR